MESPLWAIFKIKLEIFMCPDCVWSCLETEYTKQPKIVFAGILYYTMILLLNALNVAAQLFF